MYVCVKLDKGPELQEDTLMIGNGLERKIFVLYNNLERKKIIYAWKLGIICKMEKYLFYRGNPND